MWSQPVPSPTAYGRNQMERRALLRANRIVLRDGFWTNGTGSFKWEQGSNVHLCNMQDGLCVQDNYAKLS